MVLLFYQNKPSVILGRFQNPWKESNPLLCHQDGVDLVRRQSGGGTVFHDLGNLNFSFICPREIYDKKNHAKKLLEALSHFGIEGREGEKFDLYVGPNKISGSAFKENRDRCFHHGTLLFDSNLSQLIRLCTGFNLSLETKAIPSRPAKTINIKEVNSKITIEDFVRQMADIINVKRILPIEEYSIDPVYLEKLKSWEWIIGETPKFQFNDIFVEKGVIKKWPGNEKEEGQKLRANDNWPLG